MYPWLWTGAKFLGGAAAYSLADAGIRGLGGSPEKALQKRASQERYAQQRAIGMLVEGERYLKNKRRHKREALGDAGNLYGAIESLNALDAPMRQQGDDKLMAEAFLDEATGPGFARRVKEAATRGELPATYRAMGIRKLA